LASALNEALARIAEDQSVNVVVIHRRRARFLCRRRPRGDR